MSDKPSTIVAMKFAILALAAGCLGATCVAPGSQNEPCVVDQECGDDFVCYQGACTSTCAFDSDCRAGSICRSEARTARDDVVEVCVTEDDNDIIDTTCRNDDQCESQFPDRFARCGVDGRCLLPAFSLLIRDTTVAATQSPADGGVGADVAAIYLTDSDSDTPVAWADTIVAATAEALPPLDPLPFGDAIALNDDNTCVNGSFDESVLSLGGDGGYVLVRFLETGTGNVVNTPPSTWNIVVIEWGDNCGADADSPPDSLALYGCTSTSHDSTSLDVDCGELLAEAPDGGLVAVSP